MKEHTKDLIVTTVLAATLVSTLVFASDFIASHLGSDRTFPLAYGVTSIIEDDGFTEEYEESIMSLGGAIKTQEYRLRARFFFENGSILTPRDITEGLRSYTAYNGTFDASVLVEIQLSMSTIGFYGAYSDEFVNFTRAGNFSWFGNYNAGREIQSSLHVGGEEIDLGTSFDTNITFVLDMNAETLLNRDIRYGVGPRVFEYDGLWERVHTWKMETVQLLEMVGESQSASIIFGGSVWLNGNHTITVNNVEKNETTSLSKQVSFGRMDLTFEDGKMSTLSFNFNRVDLLLLVHPEE